MTNLENAKKELFDIARLYLKKYKLSSSVDETYFEPGMMENLDQYRGMYDAASNCLLLRFDAKGLRYDNRTTNLENINAGDDLRIVRETNNPYNANNFLIQSVEQASLGNLPADLCNALAPLYDAGYAVIVRSKATHIEKIRERSRYAKQGVLFVELIIRFRGV